MSMDIEWEPPSDTESIECHGVTDEFFLYEIARIKAQAQTLLTRASEMERIFKKRSAEQDGYISYLRGLIRGLETRIAILQKED